MNIKGKVIKNHYKPLITTLALPRAPRDWGAGGIPMGGDSGLESAQAQGRGVTWEGLAWQQGSGVPGGCVSRLSSVGRGRGPGDRVASWGRGGGGGVGASLPPASL